MTDPYNLDTLFDDLSHRDIISNALHQGKVNVSFTKADGTQRQMLCTLNESYMPVVVAETPSPDAVSTPRKKNDATQVVWDIDACGWRSFRWDSILAFNFTTNSVRQWNHT